MKIAMLLSGGVDSSVALNLLAREKKYDITAFYLKIWLEDELAYLGDCPWESDLEFVRSICEELDIPLEIVPLQQEYLDTVIDYAIQELKSGRTPSPDILCNSSIKFGVFFDRIDDSFEKVATGHYAQIDADGGKCHLRQSPDPIKDQTYFLYRLTQAQLARAMFPIGHLHKKEVRRLAETYNLPNKMRKDSQGLCFLGKIKYENFVKHHLGEKPGSIIEVETKKKLGDHSGYWFHTIGQRQGLGLSGGPWFVVGKDVSANIIYVSHQDQLNQCTRNEFTVSNLHWIADRPAKTSLKLKIRHGPKMFDCEIVQSGNEDISPPYSGFRNIVRNPLGVSSKSSENCTACSINVTIGENETGIASGQSAIFYDNEICLGGGIIQ